jgi:hypothetical protein
MALSDTDVLDKLYVARDNLLEQKVQLTLSPKPTYNIDGQEILWKDYLEYLDKALIDILKIIQAHEGPFEETTEYQPI